MISGMIGYKWAVKGSTWGDAVIFGVLTMLINMLFAFIAREIGIEFMFLGSILLGLSAYLMAAFWKRFSNSLSFNIAIRTIAVSIIISLILLGLIGVMFITILGASSSV